MELILVRHPETQANEDQVFYSEQDYSFTKRGNIELKNIVSELKDLDYRVYSSPYDRALKVAQLISNDVTIDSRLKEIDFGDFKGLTVNEVKSDYPDDYLAFTTRQEGYVFPSGESYDTFYKRIAAFIDVIVSDDVDTIVLTHGGVINMILRRYFSLEKCYPKTGAIIKLKLSVEDY
jgi:broad specificity phosphatase PhoE